MFSDADGRIAADEVDFDVANGTGTFKNASGSMRIGSGVNLTDFAGQDPDVYFCGEIIEKLGPRRYRLTRGAFTTCVQPTPRWEADQQDRHINLDDYAFARNMVLKVKGVPVFYLPAIYYPIQDDNRATGFLLPTYGTSTLRGQAITNGFFWAINRSQDATLVHDWYTRSGQGAGGEYRYVASDQSLGNVRLYGFSRNETTFTEDGVTTVLPASNSFQVHRHGQPGIGARLRARGYVDYFSDIVTQQLYNQNIYQATQSRADDRGQPQRHVRRHLDERPLPAQRVPDRRDLLERLRQHAAPLGERRPADALRHAHLCVGGHRVRAHPQPADSRAAW